MQRRTLAFSLAAAVATVAPRASAGDQQWRSVADVGVGAVLAGAVIDTGVHHDWTGAKQLAFDLALTELATYGLKHAFREERPNRQDRNSFPSGHASRSFAAAAYLEKRYGWEVGAPALGVATLVGVARVESHDHHWYDVVAGAALGAGTSYLFTTRHNARVMLAPWSDGSGLGLTLAGVF